jgi:hypothetical protein
MAAEHPDMVEEPHWPAAAAQPDAGIATTYRATRDGQK